MAEKTTDFDPDVYLQEAQGGVAVAPAGDFNPDEYLTGQPPPGTSPAISPLDIGIPVPGLGGATLSPNRLFQTVKNLGLEGGGATLGQVVGAPFEAVGGMHIGGAIGGASGNALAQLTTPGKKFSWGEVTAAGAAGAIPGGSLVKAGGKELLKQGTKYAAANVAGTNIQSLIDTGKAAPLSQDLLAAGTGLAGAPISKFLDRGMRAEAARVLRSKGSYDRETLKLGHELGYTLPPSIIAPNIVNDSLTSLGGKAAVAQSAIHLNQPKTDAAIAAQIGIPTEATLSPISINTQRVVPNLVYDKVAKAVPESAQLLAAYKQANAETNKLFTAYRSSLVKDPALLSQAKVSQELASGLESQLGKAVGPDLIKELKGARVKLAEIGLAERAFTGGNFDASVIGDAFENGERLTGNFYKIGRFENKFGKNLKLASQTPAPGVDHLKLLAKGALFGGGVMSGNPLVAVAAPVAMAVSERAARAGVLTPAYQRNMAQPFYGASIEDAPAAIARLGAMEAGRELPSLDTPLTEEEMKRLEELRARLTKQ